MCVHVCCMYVFFMCLWNVKLSLAIKGIGMLPNYVYDRAAVLL